MMTREEKIEEIYEVIADKTLSFGCRLVMFDIVWRTIDYTMDIVYMWDEELFIDTSCSWWKCWNDVKIHKIKWDHITVLESICWDRDDYWASADYLKSKYKTIGHPVMIGDVLDWYCNVYYSNTYWPKEYKDIDLCWWEKRKPIEEQSDECINFIHSLITNV